MVNISISYTLVRWLPKKSVHHRWFLLVALLVIRLPVLQMKHDLSGISA